MRNEHEFHITLATQIKQQQQITKSITLEALSEVNKILSSDSELSNKLSSFVIIHGNTRHKAFVMYPQISSTRLNIQEDKPLRPSDFYYILYNPEIIGNIEPSGLFVRIKEERLSFLLAFALFLTSLWCKRAPVW